MTKESTVFFLGILVLILPHIGIPEDWKGRSLFVVGALLMIIGYSLRRKAYIRSIEKEDGERDTDSFMEHDGSRTDVIRDDHHSA